MRRQCTKCGDIKPLAEFYADGKGRGGYAARCKACTRKATRAYAVSHPEQRLHVRRWHKDNPHAIRSAILKHKYGITLEEYETMLAQQEGGCAICRKPPGHKRLAVDHDHGTGDVRGLLCDACNQGIGLAGDNPAILLAAVAYLQKSAVNGE